MFTGKMKTNDGIISVEHENFQVDFICDHENFHSHLDYISYNSVGELIGRLANRLNMKYGHRGLLFVMVDEKNEANVSELHLCSDTEKIMEFFGLNYEKWRAGFRTIDEMFRWFTMADKFDLTTFEEVFLSSALRQKNRKRKTFSAFMNWLEVNEPVSNFTFGPRSKRHQYIPEIAEAFDVDVVMESEAFQQKMNVQRARAHKFNGEMAMEISKFRGKQLGDFIAAFRSYIEDMKPFDDYVDSRRAETIHADMKDFFEEEYAVVRTK